MRLYIQLIQFVIEMQLNMVNKESMRQLEICSSVKQEFPFPSAINRKPKDKLNWNCAFGKNNTY